MKQKKQTTNSGKRSHPKKESKHSTISGATHGSGEVDVRNDFEELFACLNAEKVKYLIIGGYAVAFYAKPRYTKDIDIWVESTLNNGDKIVRALNRFGFGQLKISAKDFTRPTGIIQLGFAPNRVDLLNSIPGIVFAQAWKNKVKAVYGKQPVYYIGKNDLIRNKAAVGRPVDLQDIKWLRI